MADQVISVRGLGARAGSAVLLAGVDLEVAAGEVLTPLGPSGAGKTTVAEAIAGGWPARG